MYDLRLLSAFAQSVRSGSFTEAARVLRCSPGAISKNVARLEHELGIRLFNRTTRQLSLTEEGAELHDAISRSLAELERAEDIAATARGTVEGTVNLALGSAFGKSQLLPRLPRLLERHPRLRVEIAFTDDCGDLVANGHDLAVRSGAPDDSRYICRRLHRLPLKLVASAVHVERHGAPQHPEDLSHRDCINVRHGDTECSWLFRRRDCQDHIPVLVQPQCRIIITQQIEAVVDAALSSLGPTVIDSHAARPHLETGALVELLPEWEVESAIEGGSDLYIIYPHRHYLPLRIRAMIAFLVEEFAEGMTAPNVPIAMDHRIADRRMP
ncbi:LysR family transcriptional regulator [Sphingobium chlorophenolicum]|uniref:Transcriptional regulator (LysR family protein) n=1 Tax=Sphingobium chlorophenolicum TaxID=46429 RepID=A0A081R9S2_SPHCR|nr:LysR family transcriptional regulator [Sphingobium chlorophenolicum]KEQ51945.1 Transcriptional regulator (LysR family protein) [Sphingobium chlorophenolicum]